MEKKEIFLKIFVKGNATDFFFFPFLKRVKLLNILNQQKRDLLVVWVF